MNNFSLFELLQISYKKLKATVYFDKTQLVLRNRIVEYEETDVDDKLKILADNLESSLQWNDYINSFLDNTDVLIFPKTLVECKSDTAIFNGDIAPITLEKPQYFIDMPVECHILGVLWILTIGIELDKNCDEDNPFGMYEHSYGNRLSKKLVSSKTGNITFSPTLFEPYFQQYESWRDYGLEQAKSRLNDKQDALILTLDFKSFYYNVDLTEQDFDDFLNRVNYPEPWLARVNQFVFDVIKTYSKKLRNCHKDSKELNLGTRNLLPIGFLPSNILSNYVLTAFDNAIIEKWNPVYYGRYVDDIIIVDKVEKNSLLYKEARASENRLSAKRVIDIFLAQTGILDTSGDLSKVRSSIGISENSNVCVQDGKVRMFYFQSGATRALLNCFQTQIAQNASEFRMLPNTEDVLDYQNYSEIFKLNNEEGINKFRGITSMELDKFALSKFLGKYRKVSSLITDKQENAFEKDLMMIFDERTLIANYSVWERLLEILMVNSRLDLVEKLVLKIIDSIKRYDIPSEICDSYKGRIALYGVLHSAYCRATALIWGKSIAYAIIRIWERIVEKFIVTDDELYVHIMKFEPNIVFNYRKKYCESRMVNKYVMPLPIDCLAINYSDYEEDLHLCKLESVLSTMNKDFCKNSWNRKYYYYPYIVTPQEISFVMTCFDIINHESSIKVMEHDSHIKDAFFQINFPSYVYTDKRNDHNNVCETISFKNDLGRNTIVTNVKPTCTDENKPLRVAIGNAELNIKHFHAVLNEKPCRSHERYKKLRTLLNTAIEEKVDLLVLPENYVPFEWMPTIIRLCANNNLGLITGIEHIVAPSTDNDSSKVVYNLTATVLPYKIDDYPVAYVSYHNKTEYSPAERKHILGRRYSIKSGNTYQLFVWRNIWFPVYCCYELASIHDRALFQYYSDLIAAVEWNRDVPYFSNIIESLSRDLHCYCIQANSSDYGDSRVIAPKDSVNKDIIKTKGGKNSCILVDTIDIQKLRDFQLDQPELQSENHEFKTVPPGFKYNILEKKINGSLWEFLKAQERELK